MNEALELIYSYMQSRYRVNERIYVDVYHRDLMYLYSVEFPQNIKLQLEEAMRRRIISRKLLEKYDSCLEKYNEELLNLANEIRNDADFVQLIEDIKANNTLKKEENGYNNEAIAKYSNPEVPMILDCYFVVEDFIEYIVNQIPRPSYEDVVYQTKGRRGEKIYYYFYERFAEVAKKFDFSKVEKALEELKASILKIIEILNG
jgi:hypothetical protein